MQKTILALAICGLIPCVYVAIAYADDGAEIVDIRGVVQRMGCDDIKKEMDLLSAQDALSDEDANRLSSLKTDYRSQCMKTSRGRSKGRSKVSVMEITENVADESQDENILSGDSCDVPDANGCCPGEIYTDLGDQGFNCCTENKEHCFPPMRVDIPKCEDGNQPDVNGCCSGETYTDLGNQGFNCCLADGVTCYPPLGK